MRISTKGRYALAAMINMAAAYDNGEKHTVNGISEKLGISKIYLEQIFSLLKSSGLVSSVKGSHGGYSLLSLPREISAASILAAVEPSIFEETKDTVIEKAPEIDKAIRSSIFDALDKNIKDTLSGITLDSLVMEAEKNKADERMMFYI